MAQRLGRDALAEPPSPNERVVRSARVALDRTRAPVEDDRGKERGRGAADAQADVRPRTVPTPMAVAHCEPKVGPAAAEIARAYRQRRHLARELVLERRLPRVRMQAG